MNRHHTFIYTAALLLLFFSGECVFKTAAVQRVPPVSCRRFESQKSESLPEKSPKKTKIQIKSDKFDPKSEAAHLSDLIGIKVSDESVDIDKREAKILTETNKKFHFSETDWVEVFRGASVILMGDGGSFYEFIRSNFSEAYQRSSSHKSMSPQLGLDLGSAMKTMLLGKTNKGDTWFQLELHPYDPWRKPWASMAHAWDAVIHFFTGKNIGPWGKSLHTDKKPLVLFAA